MSIVIYRFDSRRRHILPTPAFFFAGVAVFFAGVAALFVRVAVFFAGVAALFAGVAAKNHPQAISQITKHRFGRRTSMKKKIMIAFFCATLSVCVIYGGLRYIVASGTGQVTMAGMLEEENIVDDRETLIKEFP